MRKDITDYCMSCTICQKRKKPQERSKTPIQPILIEEPWELIGMDITGPLNKTKDGNRYILVFSDYVTKFAVAKAIPDQSAETVAKALVEDIFCRYGSPSRVLSDQGKSFRKSITTAYHPQCDGLVERFNRTLKNTITKYVELEYERWDEYLHKFYSIQTAFWTRTKNYC